MATTPEVLELQRQINRFTEEVGFAALPEDGLMSAEVAAAVVGILKFYGVGGWSQITADAVAFAPVGFANQLRALADSGGHGSIKPPDLESLIAQAATLCRTTPGDTRCKQARVACAQGNLTPAVTRLCAQIAPPISNTLWWVVGGVVAAALVGTVGYTVYARRKNSLQSDRPRRRLR